MDALNAILTRRSIRRFAGDKVSLETLRELAQAGMFAPSAADEQPWYFVLITERNLLDQIPAIHPYASMMTEVTGAILVCGDEDLARHGEMWIQGCAAATENILLAAHAKGLGSVWVGVYPRQERMQPLRELFGIPPHVQPFALLPIGTPAEKPEPSERQHPGRVRVNHW